MAVCGAQGAQAAHLSMRLRRLVDPLLHAETICSERGHHLQCCLEFTDSVRPLRANPHGAIMTRTVIKHVY